MTKIIQRHDTAANWTSVNPVLAAGEMGVETDTNKFKFGDGTSTWSELAYATSGSGGGGTQLTSADGTTTYSKLALGDNLVVDTGEIAWINPRMTSNSQDGYIATASVSSSSTGSEIYKAFDKDTTTSENCWYTGSVSMPQWIMLECPEPVQLTSCTITNEVSTPVNFKSGYIQGSNDGSTFDTLYTITDRPNTTGYSETYTFENTTYYKYLRVYCTASYGSGLSIQEIEFKGFVKDASGIPSLNVNLDTKQDKLTAVSPIKIYTDDIKNVNVTPVSGAVINEDNTFTGGTGYLTYNHQWNLNTASSWEYRFKIRFGGWNSSQTQAIFAPIGADYQHPVFVFQSNNQIVLFVSTNGSSWDTVVASQNAMDTRLIAGNIYYFKCGFSGSNYYIQYNSTGWGTEFTQLASVTSSNKVPNYTGTMSLCGPVQPCTSTLYLEEYRLIVDGVNVFTALKVEPNVLAIGSNKATTSSLGVVQPDGTSITVSETGIISAVGGVQSSTIHSMVVMTQAEYDALTTKDATALYLIREETT